MTIITLITDMGTRDHYVAMVKGAILSQLPEATIVDVTHAIKPFHNPEAVHVLRNAYPAFPKGTIHIVGVNPEADRFTVHVVAKHDGHYFIGADNGIFPLAFDGMPEEAYEITMKLDDDHAAFPMKTVFVKAACHLARGGKPETIGRRMTSLRELFNIKPKSDENCIVGQVVYTDHYGNLITNVSRSLFDKVRGGRSFRIGFGLPADDITRLHKTYGDVSNGVCLAFFNASGDLEIAVNKGVEGSGGGAARLLGLRENDPVRIDFSAKART
ncbi:MAG: SAM-dependent chlorinase/fluorinase [Flavobacteriales bacterium]|nr:SAM-dependent chlorinase/fluorinase [Flavobacteriales bacterium]